MCYELIECKNSVVLHNWLSRTELLSFADLDFQLYSSQKYVKTVARRKEN